MKLPQVYEDLHKRVLANKDLRLYHDVYYSCDWNLWDVWTPSGYGIQKIPFLQGVYIDFNHLEDTKELFHKYWNRSSFRTKGFAVTFHFGNIIQQKPEILKLIDQLKLQGNKGSKEARQIRTKLRKLGHSGGLIDTKKATGGLCITSIIFRASPVREIYPLVTFRTVEITRRLLADIMLVENVFRQVLSDCYQYIKKVEINFGIPWVANYNLILVKNLLPVAIKSLHPSLKSYLKINKEVNYTAHKKAQELSNKFSSSPMIINGKVQAEFRKFKFRPLIKRGE